MLPERWVALTRVVGHDGSQAAPSCRSNVNGEENMATGLYVLQDGSVIVAYGPRHIPISCAQYKANGYNPVLEKLMAKSPGANKPWSVLRSPRDSRLVR